MAVMQGYWAFQCYLFCVFLIGISIAAEFHTTELNASSSYRYLVPDWQNIVKSDKIHVWIISAVSEGARLKIGSVYFRFKDKLYNSTCPQYLQVNDGRSPTENILGRWCGINGPELISSGPSLTLVYVPDDSHGSFSIDYIESIGRSVPLSSEIMLYADNQERTFSSPEYPLNYYNSMDYTWIINAEPGRRVRTNILYLDLGEHAIISFDYIQFFDGNSTDNPSIGKVYTSFDGSEFTSTGSYLTVWFRSHAAYVGKGFEIQYRDEAIPSGCSSGTLEAGSSETNYIRSPGYPMYTQSFQNCTWTITTSSFFKYVKVEGLWLELEESDGCIKDHLAFYDENLSNEIGRVCGNKASTGFNFQSTSQQMIVKYLTYGSTPSMFWLKYTALSKNEVNLITDEAHIITSPNYPQLYPANADEWWSIHSPIGVVKMVSLAFNLEYSSRCALDYLEAYDGYDATSPLIGRWCGYDRVSASSTGILLFLKFHSNSIIQGSGFELSFTAEKEVTPQAPAENYTLISSTVVMSIIGLIVIISIVACFVASRRKRSTPVRTATYTRNPPEVAVVNVNNESMAPPEYSEVLKDGPPTYFEATGAGFDNLVIHDNEAVGLENPAVSQS